MWFSTLNHGHIAVYGSVVHELIPLEFRVEFGIELIPFEGLEWGIRLIPEAGNGSNS